ncbi:hypothetical protein GQ44DRAFT_631501 [Phaeosphaeriaceae sp. PMI808]|nr:hypothetical protein GQ44DRAFT_631501 [Phaeosphaeriaceae sp. PMI808]
MGFLNNLVSEFTHSGQQGQQSGGSQQGGPQQGPPPVSPPWSAEWDGRDNRWLFVNQQSGERTFTYPGPGYTQQQGSYGTPQGGYGYNQGGYSNQGASNQGSYNPTNSGQEEKKSGGNGWKYAAAGVAGVAGGALLMHEGHEMKRRFDEFGNEITNFPENAAGWTGEQVGRAENFGDRVEYRVDEFGNDVENFPENAANWTGEQWDDGVQDIEDIPQDIENKWDNAVDDVAEFGGRMDQAYDDGRDEQRYEDDY